VGSNPVASAGSGTIHYGDRRVADIPRGRLSLEDEREFQELDIPGMEAVLDRYGWNEELCGRLLEELSCRRDTSAAARNLRGRLVRLPGVRKGTGTTSTRANQSTGEREEAAATRRRLDLLAGEVATIRPPGTANLPKASPKWFDDSFSLAIAPNASRCTRYRVALEAYIEEIRLSRYGRLCELRNGLRISQWGNSNTYTFETPSTDQIMEGADVDLVLEGESIECSVRTIAPAEISLVIPRDLGLELPKAQLRLNDRKLLERLCERLRAVESGEMEFNSALADAVVSAASAPRPQPLGNFEAPATLNPSQSQALQHASSNAVTFIWGPPGCGKTLTLGEIVRLMFDAGKRVLICSNTNTAVDQVLYSICNALGKEHDALQTGRIVRLGAIADAKLSQQFGAFVDLDRIVIRLTAQLRVRQDELEAQMAMLERNLGPIREALRRFEQLDTANRQFHQMSIHLQDLQSNEIVLQQKLAANDRRVAALSVELRRTSGWLRSLRRSPLVVRGEFDVAQAEGNRLEGLRQENVVAMQNARIDAEALASSCWQLADSLLGQSREAFESEHTQLIAELIVLTSERDALEQEIAQLRATILREARIIGATGTRAYLKPQDMGLLDLVIVDEASMLLQPVIWLVAGLSRERVIICGDFRQLPAIFHSERRVLIDLLARDVFAAAGVSALERADTRMVMLDTQYRMLEPICALIKERMYGGRLQTTSDEAWHLERAARVVPPSPFDATLTLIDTSALRPMQGREGQSRFSPMHALLVRNLADHLTRSGFARGNTDLAVCTPYAAQARLIGSLLREASLGHVKVGTVHSFQGDQRNAVIIDFPDSHGSDIGYFLKGVRADETSSRLLNVAASRAENHLIVLANLQQLDARLPSDSLLRGILCDMQSGGRVLPATALLGLNPQGPDLAGLDGGLLDATARRFGVFNSQTFDRALAADLARARSSVVIFSGFVSRQRVGELEAALHAATEDNVKVRCVSRPPKKNFPANPRTGAEAFATLEKIGCVVDSRARIHEKAIIIDEHIVWHGSLNALSFAQGTDELMTRIVSKETARAIAFILAKRRVSLQMVLDVVADAENPRCGACGGRTYYEQRRDTDYFICEHGCDWRAVLSESGELMQPGRDQGARAESSASDLIDTRNGSPSYDLQTATRPYRKYGPPCPRCHSDTRLRLNRTEQTYFYGCSRFGEGCRGTINIPAEREGRG